MVQLNLPPTTNQSSPYTTTCLLLFPCFVLRIVFLCIISLFLNLSHLFVALILFQWIYISMVWIRLSSPTTLRSQTGTNRQLRNQQKKAAVAPLCDAHLVGLLVSEGRLLHCRWSDNFRFSDVGLILFLLSLYTIYRSFMCSPLVHFF